MFSQLNNISYYLKKSLRGIKEIKKKLKYYSKTLEHTEYFITKQKNILKINCNLKPQIKQKSKN